MGDYVGYAVFALVGAAFAAFGVMEVRSALRLTRHGVRTEAIFAGWEKRESSSEGRKETSHYAIFEFTDTIGREHRSVLRETGGTYTEGYPVEIFYDPEDPSDISVATFLGLWLGAILGLGVGLTAMGIGFLLWLAKVPVKWN